MDVACPGNPPFGRDRPPLVAGAGGGEVVVASKVTMHVRANEGTRNAGPGEVRSSGEDAVAALRRFCRGRGADPGRPVREPEPAGGVSPVCPTACERNGPGPCL